MPNELSIKQKGQNLLDVLEQNKGALQKVLPRHLTADRMVRVALTSIRKQPLLLEAEPKSVLAAIMECGVWGLEPDGISGQAYLLPFFNKKKNQHECQLIVGYKGLIRLVRNSDQVRTVDACVVYSNERFTVTRGTSSSIVHEPMIVGERGEVVGAYAVIQFTNGGYQFDLMSVPEIEAIRARSQYGSKGPWKTDWNEMAKKTVLLRLMKLCPVTPEVTRAVALDELASVDVPQDLTTTAEFTEVSEPEPADVCTCVDTTDETTGEVTTVNNGCKVHTPEAWQKPDPRKSTAATVPDHMAPSPHLSTDEEKALRQRVFLAAKELDIIKEGVADDGKPHKHFIPESGAAEMLHKSDPVWLKDLSIWDSNALLVWMKERKAERDSRDAEEALR